MTLLGSLGYRGSTPRLCCSSFLRYACPYKRRPVLNNMHSSGLKCWADILTRR